MYTAYKHTDFICHGKEFVQSACAVTNLNKIFVQKATGPCILNDAVLFGRLPYYSWTQTTRWVNDSSSPTDRTITLRCCDVVNRNAKSTEPQVVRLFINDYI